MVTKISQKYQFALRRRFCPKGPSDTILKESASHHWPGEYFEAQNSEEKPPEDEILTF